MSIIPIPFYKNEKLALSLLKEVVTSHKNDKKDKLLESKTLQNIRHHQNDATTTEIRKLINAYITTEAKNKVDTENGKLCLYKMTTVHHDYCWKHIEKWISTLFESCHLQLNLSSKYDQNEIVASTSDIRFIRISIGNHYYLYHAESKQWFQNAAVHCKVQNVYSTMNKLTQKMVKTTTFNNYLKYRHVTHEDEVNERYDFDPKIILARKLDPESRLFITHRQPLMKANGELQFYLDDNPDLKRLTQKQLVDCLRQYRLKQSQGELSLFFYEVWFDLKVPEHLPISYAPFRRHRPYTSRRDGHDFFIHSLINTDNKEPLFPTSYWYIPIILRPVNENDKKDKLTLSARFFQYI